MSEVDLPESLRTRLPFLQDVGVVTGAGISAASGIRPYRGKGGLYDDPLEGEATVEALTGSTLASDPDRTWAVVTALMRDAMGARPSMAHRVLVALEDHVERFALLTQNVDGLHQDAGSRAVIPIHGDVRQGRCLACGAVHRFSTEEIETLAGVPTCPTCPDGLLRPDAVLFGEMLPPERLAAFHGAFLERVPSLVLIVGTSALFPYIVEPAAEANRQGQLVVEINPEPTPASRFAHHALRCTADEGLPAVATAMGISPEAWA